MAHYPDIYFMRHGETQWNVQKRAQGQLDSPLTKLGQQQAFRLGEILSDALKSVDHYDVYASPLGRVQQTAEIALAPIGVTAKKDARLKDIRSGEWEGLTHTEIVRQDPRIGGLKAIDWFCATFQSPNGERYQQFEERLLSFLNDLSGPSVVFSHGIVGLVLRGLYLGLSFEEMADQESGQGIVFHLSGHKEKRLF